MSSPKTFENQVAQKQADKLAQEQSLARQIERKKNMVIYEKTLPALVGLKKYKQELARLSQELLDTTTLAQTQAAGLSANRGRRQKTYQANQDFLTQEGVPSAQAALNHPEYGNNEESTEFKKAKPEFQSSQEKRHTAKQELLDLTQKIATRFDLKNFVFDGRVKKDEKIKDQLDKLMEIVRDKITALETNPDYQTIVAEKAQAFKDLDPNVDNFSATKQFTELITENTDLLRQGSKLRTEIEQAWQDKLPSATEAIESTPAAKALKFFQNVDNAAEDYDQNNEKNSTPLEDFYQGINAGEEKRTHFVGGAGMCNLLYDSLDIKKKYGDNLDALLRTGAWGRTVPYVERWLLEDYDDLAQTIELRIKHDREANIDHLFIDPKTTPDDIYTNKARAYARLKQKYPHANEKEFLAAISEDNTAILLNPYFFTELAQKIAPQATAIAKDVRENDPDIPKLDSSLEKGEREKKAQEINHLIRKKIIAAIDLDTLENQPTISLPELLEKMRHDAGIDIMPEDKKAELRDYLASPEEGYRYSRWRVEHDYNEQLKSTLNDNVQKKTAIDNVIIRKILDAEIAKEQAELKKLENRWNKQQGPYPDFLQGEIKTLSEEIAKKKLYLELLNNPEAEITTDPGVDNEELSDFPKIGEFQSAVAEIKQLEKLDLPIKLLENIVIYRDYNWKYKAYQKLTVDLQKKWDGYSQNLETLRINLANIQNELRYTSKAHFIKRPKLKDEIKALEKQQAAIKNDPAYRDLEHAVYYDLVAAIEKLKTVNWEHLLRPSATREKRYREWEYEGRYYDNRVGQETICPQSEYIPLTTILEKLKNNLAQQITAEQERLTHIEQAYASGIEGDKKAARHEQSLAKWAAYKKPIDTACKERKLAYAETAKEQFPPSNIYQRI